MTGLFQKRKLLYTLLVGFFILTVIIGIDMVIQNQMKKIFSTPELIDRALARREITEEVRLLYLAYALYENKSLPTRYVSRVGWFGEMYAWELQEALTPPEVVCSMSPHVRDEFQRLFKLDITCKRSLLFSVL